MHKTLDIWQPKYSANKNLILKDAKSQNFLILLSNMIFTKNGKYHDFYPSKNVIHVHFLLFSYQYQNNFIMKNKIVVHRHNFQIKSPQLVSDTGPGQFQGQRMRCNEISCEWQRCQLNMAVAPS